MFLHKVVSRCLTARYSFTFSNNVRAFCLVYDKNFNYFRNRIEYKNSVVQLNSELNESKVAGPGFSFLLKDHNIQTEGYFSHLTQRENVMKLSATQVKELLFLMANIRIDTSKYATILNYLDEKCALSAERWPLDLSFYVLDAWFIIWGPKLYQKHYYTAITSLWGRKINKCSKFNLILMLYFIGMSKVSPPFLMESIEDRMERFVADFSDEELAVACLSYFKTSKRINSDSLLRQSCLAAENFLSKNDRFNAISILKCLRLSKFYDEKLWDVLKDYTVKEINTFNFVECTNFLAVFASQNVYDEALFNYIENRGILTLQEEAHLMANNESDLSPKTHPSIRSRVKDIARFMWGLTSVGHPVKEPSLQYISDIVKERISSGDFDSQSHVLIDCLQSFTLASYYPQEILATVLTKSTLKKVYNSDRAKPKYQLFFIQKSIQVEKPELQYDLRTIFNPIPKRLDRELNERKGLKDIKNILSKTSIKNFKVCYVMPHIMIAGIIVGENLDSTNSPKKLGNDLRLYKKYIDEGIISKQASDIFYSGNVFTVIEVLDPTMCAIGSESPLGLMKAKIRQLKALNFKTVTLSTKQIDTLMQKDISKDCQSIQGLIEFL